MLEHKQININSYKKIINSKNIEIVYRYSKNAADSDLDKLFSSSEVVIDFSSPQATQTIINKALQFNTKLLIGTTGISSSDHEHMVQAAKKIAIFYTPNTNCHIIRA